jgi:hypothetical protein
MPQGVIGEKNNLDRDNNFLELKAKDQKIQVRFVKQDYYYEGKHFMQEEDGRWLVTDCPRINLGEEHNCEYCVKYFEIMKPMRELKQQMKVAETDQAKAEIQVKIDAVTKKARPYKVQIGFFYAVLDRADGKAKIFKTKPSIRIALEQFEETDEDFIDYDYLIVRTQQPGAGYYSMKAVDSKKTVELSVEEKAEIKKAEEWNLSEMVGGKPGSHKVGEEEEEEEPQPQP